MASKRFLPGYEHMALGETEVISFGPQVVMTHPSPMFERLARTLADGQALTQPSQCPTCRHREARILARENQKRQSRRRWVGRLVVAVLVIVLGSLAFYRFGHDPMASVQR